MCAIVTLMILNVQKLQMVFQNVQEYHLLYVVSGGCLQLILTFLTSKTTWKSLLAINLTTSFRFVAELLYYH